MAATLLFKRAVRRLLRPFVRRLTGGMDARVAALEAGWDRHLPAFLAAASSVGAFGHELLELRRDLQRQIDELAGTTETRHRARAKRGGVAVETLAAAPLKLRLGGGSGDVVADPGAAPFAVASVAELDVGDLLDRIPSEELRDRVLPSWHALLMPEGTLHAVVRDAGAAVAALAAGKSSFEEFRADLLYRDDDGWYRGNLFTRESLLTLLTGAGFVAIAVVAAERHDRPRHLTIRASSSAG